jgi:hypothetical protein
VTVRRLPATPSSTSRPFVRSRASGPFWYGKWYRARAPVIRSLGRAWVLVDGDGGWNARRGRPTDGALTEAQAARRMLELMREHDAREGLLERDADVRRREGISFRELAHEYLPWVAEVKDAKPSTLSGYRYLLAEPGTRRQRGSGVADGFIMAALGDTPIAAITTRDIEGVLSAIAAPRSKTVIDAAGQTRPVVYRVAPRTVNQHRQLMSAIFNYAMRPSTYGLAANPVVYADRRREPERGPLAYYSVEQVEALARSLERGAHRDPKAVEVGEEERAARAAEDARDGELIRVAAFTGLRRGELVALRGAMSISRRTRSPFVGRSPPAWRRARRRAVARVRCRCPIRPPAHLTGSASQVSSSARTSSCSATDSDGVWMQRRCGGGLSGRATRPACRGCVFMICATPTVRYWSPPGSICRA